MAQSEKLCAIHFRCYILFDFFAENEIIYLKHIALFLQAMLPLLL